MDKILLLNKKTGRIFAFYFRDHFEHLLVITVAMPILFVAAILWKGWNPLFLILPGIVVINYIVLFKYFDFFIKSVRDVENGKYCEKNISIDSIAVTPVHNMRSKLGRVRGAERLTIITTDNERFFITADKGEVPVEELEMLIAISENMKITYLPSTNFVIAMACNGRKDYVDTQRGFSAFRALWQYNTDEGIELPVKKSTLSFFGIISNARVADKERTARENAKLSQMTEHKKEAKRVRKMTAEELSDLSDDALYDAVYTRIMYDDDAKLPHKDDYLSSPRNVVRMVLSFEAEIQNGGISQYFLNSTRYDAPYISKALEMIGAGDYKKKFDLFITENGIDLYNFDYCESDGFFSFDEDSNYTSDDFDNDFYSMCTLEELVIKYIRSNITRI